MLNISAKTLCSIVCVCSRPRQGPRSRRVHLARTAPWSPHSRERVHVEVGRSALRSHGCSNHGSLGLTHPLIGDGHIPELFLVRFFHCLCVADHSGVIRMGCPKRTPSTARPLSRGPWALIGLPFSVWTGACYWHGVGGSVFNSSSSLARDPRVLICWPLPLGFSLDGFLLLTRRGRVYVEFIIIITTEYGVGGFVRSSLSCMLPWFSQAAPLSLGAAAAPPRTTMTRRST